MPQSLSHRSYDPHQITYEKLEVLSYPVTSSTGAGVGHHSIQPPEHVPQTVQSIAHTHPPQPAFLHQCMALAVEDVGQLWLESELL